MQNLQLTSGLLTSTSFHKNRAKLAEFWNFCKKLHRFKKPLKSSLELTGFQYTFEIKAQKFEVAMKQHQEFLRYVPLIVPLKTWLEKQVSNNAYSDEILDCFKSLIEDQIIPSNDITGRVWDLELQRKLGHEKILEDIRNSSEYSIAEQEKMIYFYSMFAKHLSLITFGFIPDIYP